MSQASWAARARAFTLAMTSLSLLGACTINDDAGVAIPIEPARLYAQNCARCHGLDGRGDAEMKKTMPVRDFSDPAWLAQANSDDLARTIMSGKNQMPSFGGALSQPKIQALSGYVKRVHRSTATAPASAPAVAPSAPAAPSLPAPAAASPSTK